MVTVQEIVERTFYISLLHQTLIRGLTINPDDYLVDQGGMRVPTKELYAQYEADKAAIEERLKAVGSGFYYIFGIGNNQVRGPKDLPRITLELKAWYPGDVGMEKEDYILDDQSGIYQAIEYDYETKHTLIDVHLCANTQDEMRTLHDIMYRALPARGYLRPYLNDYNEWKSGGLFTTGNLYIEVGNYYDHPDMNHGFLEKVYTYEVRDGLIMETIPPDATCVPIKDISCLIQPEGTDGVMLNVH